MHSLTWVHSYLTIERIVKSYLSGEPTINMWGVKLNNMFRGCGYFENLFKNRIGIKQFTHLNKFSIIQSAFTEVGAFLHNN